MDFKVKLKKLLSKELAAVDCDELVDVLEDFIYDCISEEKLLDEDVKKFSE